MAGYKFYSDNETGVQNVTVFLDDGQTVLSADSNHPRFFEIKSQLLDGDYPEYDGLEDLFSPAKGISEQFAKVSPNLEIKGNDLEYKGQVLEGVLADKIVELFEEGLDYGPFVNFLEKVQENHFEHSVENLYRWLRATGGFTLTPAGDIVGYKYLNSDRTSVHAGDNVIRNGMPLGYAHVPNHDGDVIRMDRDKVEHDSSNACSVGLHVGTWDYVKNSSTIVKVLVNPMDVVSVPTDCSGQKMRVCEYRVVGLVTSKIDSSYDVEIVQEDDDLTLDPWNDAELELVDNVDEDTTSFSKFGDLRSYPGMNGFSVSLVEGSEQDDEVEVAEVPYADEDGYLDFVDPAEIRIYKPTDTRKNHLTQERDASGRFIKKEK